MAASQHYANRTYYTFEETKTTILGDCSTVVIIDVVCLMKQPQDTQIGWRMVNPKLEHRTNLTAFNAYIWGVVHHKLQAEKGTPLIKHREFSWSGLVEHLD